MYERESSSQPPSNKLPELLTEIGLDQKLDTQLPLDLGFKDETGRDVRLGDFFGKRPVILTLVYYECPMLCTQVLNGLTSALGVLKFSVGEEFDIVTVSFDPKETPELAAGKKAAYLQRYNRPGAGKGWHFLTGDERSIAALTKAVGFRYAYNASIDQYAHVSGFMVLTPGGKLSRYFYGIEYGPRDVRLALIDTDCALNNNSETAVAYRVDSLSICQLIPVLTDPTPGGVSNPVIGGTGSPGSTIDVYVDGSPTPACTAVVDNAGNWVCDLGNIPEGPHSVVLTSTEVGATETAPPVDITIDNGPPAAPVITGPANGSTTSDSTPPLSGTSEPGATVVVSEGGTVLCTATADTTGAWSCTPATPMTDGPHTITAVATDGAGNTSTPSAPVTFTVAGTPPAAPVITGPANGSLLNTPTPAISGTSAPNTTVTVREGDTVLCTTTADTTGAWSCTPTTPLADGTHSVVANATDPVTGLTSAPSNVDTFRIDTQAPDTSFNRNPPTRTGDPEAPFGYASNEDGVSYQCSLDGGPFVACRDTYDVSDGDHTLRVRATDGAGNVDATPAEYRWTVLNTRAFAGGGCSAAPATSWLPLLALLGLRLRRKQRR